MAFASGPVSFQRFFITGPFHEEVTEDFIGALEGRGFGKLAPAPDDTQTGWIGPRHVLDTEIDPQQIGVGQFAHFALRIDRFRTPSNVLRAYVQMEEDAALRASGRAFLSKGERRNAREAARLRAEQEARGGGFRRMSAYPVLIDLAAGTVYLGNLGGAVGERFMLLFSDTFGRALEPADPERVATRIMSAARNARVLENLPPMHLVRPPDGYEGGGFGSDLNFLGRELLTWLWHRTDAEDAPLRIRTGDELTVAVERSLRLLCDFGLSGADTISADLPTRLPEARAALRTGKQPVKAGLVIGGALGEFRLTLDGPRLAVSSLAVPEGEDEREPRARLEKRFESVADAAGLVDALFELFLLRRTSREWDAEQRAMAAWAAGASREPAVRAASA